MPRNGKEGILFSFIMSAIMIYVMAALNYGVRTGDVGATAWSYAFFNWPLAYVVGMICDLCICTPSSRAIMNRFCAQTDRAVWKGITVKFLMVVLMTVFMTIFGAIMAFGFSGGAVAGFFRMFPYNFTIALPIQMLVVAPLSGVIVHAVGDKAGWNRAARQRTPKLDVETVADVMQREVYTVSDTATVRDAIEVMLDRNTGGLPVVDGTGAVVGFVSDSDVLRRFAQDNLPVSDVSTLITGMARGEFPQLSHAELMKRNVMEIAANKVTTVNVDASIAEVCQMFGYQQYKKLPVVDGGRLVGVINRGHLTRRSFETCLEYRQSA
ncbi:CBS domain-containing protein [Bifidobacterium moukalabense]|uniref:CBS domain-containing protein n=1 Tax=Bifidobacterium moukalabense TaxID=1333651 RepID=UPI001FCE31BE|nr:CBS domain-containing protein [Bifidobacterium moukalabense]